MIDWNRVGELCAEIGTEDFEEVVGLFLEEADGVATRLRIGLSSDQVESALHFLKGSALNLGFFDLARMCQDGEKAAAKGKGADVDLLAVADTYEVSKTVFRSDLQSRTAA